jgi:hypothetical protein
MKGSWRLIGITLIGLAGCTPMPKREMRQSTAEEFSTPPPNMYNSPPDVPRDQPLLTPKTNAPPFNASPGMGGMGAPGMGAGAGPTMRR